MRLGFLQVYNEINWIGYAIDQAIKLCDKLVIIEGSQFKNFKGIPKRSNDGTLEIIAKKLEEYPNEIEIYNAIRKFSNYRKNQAAIFNFALKKCKVGEFFLPFDADEFYFEKFIDKINELIEDGKTDYFYASGMNLAFSFNWQIIFNNDKLTYSNIFFKKTKNLKFIPTHQPINYGSNKVIDESGKCLTHYMWLKPRDRVFLRLKTARNAKELASWFKKTWDKIELIENMKIPYNKGHFYLKKYNGPHPKVLKNHPWRNIEDIRKI